jgi:hypothetical protein
MARERFSDCGATDEEVLESLQEEFDMMQRTARQFAARCRELEAALQELRQKATGGDIHFMTVRRICDKALATPQSKGGE